MRRVLTITAAALGAIALATPAVLASTSNAPDESGVVSRFQEPGAQGLFDVTSRLDGESRPLVAFFNVESTEMFCEGGVAGAGDLQVVETPSGIRNFLLRDHVPVLVFDVTGMGSTHEEVFAHLPDAVCGQGLEPFATGVADVTNNVQLNTRNETFRHAFDATGHVTNGETTWNLSAHRRAEGELPLVAPPPVDDTINLARTGR